MITKKHEKYLRQLHQKKYRSLYSEFLVEGMRLCEELLASDYSIKEVYYAPSLLKQKRGQILLENIQKKGISHTSVSEEILEKICTTKTPSPIMANVNQKTRELNKQLLSGSRFLVLENVSDPGNVGTLIRTAEAFSWDALFLVNESVELYNPKLVRATMGSLFRFPIFCTTLSELMSFFEYSSVSYVVTSLENGCDPSQLELPKKIILFLGNEAHGISETLEKKAHYKIKIPLQKVESLNISIAGGILLFLFRANH